MSPNKIKIPENLENREGFFDMPVDDSADIIVAKDIIDIPQINLNTRIAQKHRANTCFLQQSYTNQQIYSNVRGESSNSNSANRSSSDSSTSGNTSSNDGSRSSSSSSDGEVDLSEKQLSHLSKQLGHMPFISPEKYHRTTSPKEDSNETRTVKILDFVQRKAPGRIVRRILKCTIAYFISTLFSTVNPLAKALGQAPYIVCSGCLLSHPGRTVGAQLDATLTSALGAGLAAVYGLAGIAAATFYNAKHPDSYAGNAINCLFLVVGVFAAQLVRQKFSKLHFFSLQFMVVLLFTMTAGVGHKVLPLKLSSEFGLPFLIGAFVSLFVNVIFWPETAVDGLGRTLNQTLYDTKDMLNLITNQFFLDPKAEVVSAKVVDALAEKMREGMVKVNTAYKEAKYEVSYAYTCPSDLNPIRQSLDIVTKHLSILGKSLKSEQMLFKRNFSSEEESDYNSGTTESGNEYGNSDERCASREKNETDISKAASRAVDSYIKNGCYNSPYNRSREETAQCKSSCQIYKHPATSKSRQKSENEDKMPCTSSSEPTERSEKRRSMPVSFMSLFSNSQSETPKDEGKEDNNISDSNQQTINSRRSFLNINRLSGALPKPPQKAARHISPKDRQILLTYLEKLRDPLLALAVECGAVLDCIRDSLCDQLDMSNNSDATIKHASFWGYLLHTLQIKTVHTEDYQNFLDKRKRNASFLCNCSDTLRLRIKQFDQCEKDRMQALYRINISHLHGERFDMGVRDELFLVFFFVFTMREVATNLQHMAAEVKRLQEKTAAQINKDIKSQTTTNNNKRKNKRKKRLYMPEITIQTWKKWFYSSSYQDVQDFGGYSFGYLQQNMPTNQRNVEDEYRLSRLSTNRHNTTCNVANDNVSIASSSISGTDGLYRQTTMNKRKRKTMDDDAVVLGQLEAGPLSPSTATGAAKYVTTDSMKAPPLLRFRYHLWLILRYFQGYEFKFALKLSAAVGILTLPAWLPDYQLWFATIRGQWAALTVVSIMSPTSGGTLSAGLWRLASTIIGAFAAWAVLEIDGKSGALLSGFAAVLALPFFYIHFSTSYSKVSIITLVTYMIIALSQYVRPLYSEQVSTMVWQRTATLVVGLFAALILNWMVWPFIARKAIRETLACTIGELGDYFSYVMGTFLYHDEGLFPTSDEYEEAGNIEHKLEKMLNTCNVLLELTDHEPRLKGPFPKEFYREMLISAHNLLDRMMSLRIILMKMSPSVKKTVRGLDIYHYRRDMVASILLHFYTLSASLKAKIPLPSFMPSARAARLRVLRHRRQDDRPEKLLCYRNLTWFAMGCSTEEIIDELEHLTDLVRFIVGDSKFTLKARRMERKEKICKKTGSI